MRLSESEKAEIRAYTGADNPNGYEVMLKALENSRKLLAELDEVTALLELHRDGRKTLADAYAKALVLVDEFACERDTARALARILAHAYEHDSRPPEAVVQEALAFPVHGAAPEPEPCDCRDPQCLECENRACAEDSHKAKP